MSLQDDKMLPEDKNTSAISDGQDGSSLKDGASDGEEMAGSSCGAENAGTTKGTAEGAAKGSNLHKEENLQEGAAANTVSEVSRPPKKKHRWVWNIVLIVIIGLGLYSLFGIAGEVTEGDGLTISEALKSISPTGVVLFVCCILGVMLADCLKFCVANKVVVNKVMPGIAIKTSFLGRFYDGITPFSSGGQPMQIYYMTTKGISGAHSSAIVLIRYFGTIFAFTLLGALSMILGVCFGVLDNVDGKTLLMVAGWIGLAVNLILPIFITFFICFPGLARRCTTWFINVGAKLRIVKNKEKVMAKALKTVEDFVSSFKIIIKKPLLLIAFLLCCFAENALTFSVPFFAMKAFSCDVNSLYFTIFSLNAFATFGVSFIPAPGYSGVVEGMGVLAFQVAAGATLAWSVLFWRFGVYYIYIFIGIGITVFDLILKNVRGRRAKIKAAELSSVGSEGASVSAAAQGHIPADKSGLSADGAGATVCDDCAEEALKEQTSADLAEADCAEERDEQS